LLVSTGWEGIPRFVGLTESEAVEIAENSDLFPVIQERTTGDILQDGMVIEQMTPAGTRFAPGDSITLVVGRTNEDWGTW
jgi:beta-lactam-binding protein with PASTA domain